MSIILSFEGPERRGSEIQILTRVRSSKHPELVFGYRFPAAQITRLTSWADPFVVATIFLAMARGEDMVVHGRVSPSLLENLERFQDIWACWRPGVYSRVKISATMEAEEAPGDDASAIVLFSGGVDAAFATLRHVRSDAGRASRRIDAGLMVCGMGGFQSGAESLFDVALAEARAAVAAFGVPIITLETDWQQVMLAQGLYVHDIFPAGFIACLHLFRVGVGTGIFGSSEDTQGYRFIVSGSNPLTDPLLATRRFRLLLEGSGFSRVEKIRYLAAWPEFLDSLRVCNRSARTSRNCGVCEKCIRTALAFRIAGVEPRAGLRLPTSEEIAAIPTPSPEVINCISCLLEDAKKAGLGNERWFVQLSGLVTAQAARAVT